MILIRIIVVLLIILCVRKLYMNRKKEVPTNVEIGVQKSIVGSVKDVIVKKNAIPSHYKEMEKMKNVFLGSIRNGNEPDWEILVRMGDIYSRGVYPFLQPDDQTALLMYTTGSKTPDPNVVDLSVSRYFDVKQHPVDMHDREGEIMILDYAHEVCRAANEYIRTIPEDVFESRKTTLKLAMQPPPPRTGATRFFSGPLTPEETRPRIVARVPPPPIETAPIVNNRGLINRMRARRDRERVRTENRDEITGGKQNTHDHGVTSATKTNIARLKKEFDNLGLKFDSNDIVIEKAMRMFRRVRERSKNDEKINFTADNLADAHNVVTSLVPDEYSGTGVSQTDILGLVLWKIGTLEPDIREGVEETLGKRVASGIERGVPVCATGKLSRCMSVFEGVLGDAQKSVSINVVKKEIAQLAAKVRDEFLKHVGPTGLEAYCSELSVPDYSNRMADDLRKRVKEEYIEKLNFSSKVIDPLVDSYADAY